MAQTIYIKAPQHIEVSNPAVYLKDFLTIYSNDTRLTQEIKHMLFYQFQTQTQEQIIISILKIIEFITNTFPDIQINNLGENDFIISYKPATQKSSTKEILSTIFICLIAFFGGGYAIMAYNTDIGAKELFANLSMLFIGNSQIGVAWITIFYAIGLSVGMILFFNHFGNKKINKDPTPLEIQMRLYEQDISTTIIKDISRRKESLDVKE